MFNYKEVDLTNVIESEFSLQAKLDCIEQLISMINEENLISDQKKRMITQRLLFIRNYFVEQKRQQEQMNDNSAPRPR